MANKKITDLPSLTTPASDDQLVLVDTSTTSSKRITIADLANTPGVVTPNSLSSGAPTTWVSQIWTPTIVGYSTPVAAQYRYTRTGKNIRLYINSSGNPNSTAMTFTLPVAAATTTGFFEGVGGYANNNGTQLFPRWAIDTAANPNLIAFYTSAAGGSWTNTGFREIRAIIDYEAA